MKGNGLFPALDDWEETYKTLHLYCLAVGVVARVHAKSHPKWWHIGLQVLPEGLRTVNMDLPGGGSFWFEVNLRQHRTVIYTRQGGGFELSHLDGLSGTNFGNQLLDAVSELGLTGKYARARFENDEPRSYDPAAAERFLDVLVEVNRVFSEHRATLPGDTSPVNFWTHGFDLALEWYGTRVYGNEGEGENQKYPGQINFGFFPRDEPYFYSNPWPFEAEILLDKPLPGGVNWHTEGWLGTIMPYDELVGDDDAEARLLDYFQSVFNLCSPMFLAEH